MATLLNKLVQYKGGGYDGCFWEWNFAYFDKQGKFHDVGSSGRRGCKTQEQMLEYLETESKGKDYFLYRVGLKCDWKEFFNESNVSHVKGVIAWFEEHSFPVPVSPTCPCCGHEIGGSDDIHPTDYKGDGGVGIEYTDWVCSECYSTYSCSYCGEFYGKDYEGFDNENYCEYCYEKNSNHELTILEIEKNRKEVQESSAEQIKDKFISFDVDIMRYYLREFTITDLTTEDLFDESRLQEFYDSFTDEQAAQYYEASLEFNMETTKK